MKRPWKSPISGNVMLDQARSTEHMEVEALA